jgi:hypothetical protein
MHGSHVWISPTAFLSRELDLHATITLAVSRERRQAQLREPRAVSQYAKTMERSWHLKSIDPVELRACERTGQTLGKATALPFASLRVDAAQSGAVCGLDSGTRREIHLAYVSRQDLLAKFLS